MVRVSDWYEFRDPHPWTTGGPHHRMNPRLHPLVTTLRETRWRLMNNRIFRGKFSQLSHLNTDEEFKVLYPIPINASHSESFLPSLQSIRIRTEKQTHHTTHSLHYISLHIAHLIPNGRDCWQQKIPDTYSLKQHMSHKRVCLWKYRRSIEYV